jgi:RHS repeat-associated protein
LIFFIRFCRPFCQADRVKSWRALVFLLLLVWSATGLSAKTVDALRSSRGYDGLGSVRYVADDDGHVVDTYTYDAFGILTERKARTFGGTWALFDISQPETPPTATTPTVNYYRYTGEQWDPDLGMYYLRARYYNPQIGRFWTMDSFEGSSQDPLSLQKYLYAADNPVNNIDPSGNSLVSTIGDLGIRFSLWTMSGTATAKAFAATVATLNVVAFVSDPGMYMSLGPIGAPEILAADVASLVRAGGKLFSATRSALSARNGFQILSGWRTDMRIPQVGQAGGDDVTTALLEIHDGMWIGTRFKGRSPNDPTTLHPSLRPNAITRQHAEADAFNQAAWSGTTAEKATLTVDRDLCGACGRSGGVKSMAKALGIKELTVVTPAGTEVIVIDGSVTPATGPITPYGLINAALTAQ